MENRNCTCSLILGNESDTPFGDVEAALQADSIVHNSRLQSKK